MCACVCACLTVHTKVCACVDRVCKCVCCHSSVSALTVIKQWVMKQ